MINWDYMITYGGPELFMAFTVIVVTPFIYWLVLKRFKLTVKITSIAALWIATIFIAYWDVYQISKEAERLCREEAGLHVYKTVEADSLVGVVGKNYLQKYGFQFMEMEFLSGGNIRYTLVDGNVVKEDVDKLISQHEFVRNSEVLEMPFTRNKDMIKVRKTQEILGEIVAFTIYPGWLDSRLLGIMGFTWIPARCDGDYPPERGKRIIRITDLIDVVFEEKNRVEGDT